MINMHMKVYSKSVIREMKMKTFHSENENTVRNMKTQFHIYWDG